MLAQPTSPACSGSIKIGILHIRAEDEDTDGNAVEANFDRTYQLTRTEIEARKHEAETKAAEDHITQRLSR